MHELEAVGSAPRSGRAHILTVSVEDYFHSGNFEGAIQARHWHRFEPRLEKNVSEVLDLLNRFGATATFFILGWVAERNPELVARIAEAGHEVGTRGYWPRGLENLDAGEFREDLERSRIALEAAGSNRIVGYRSPRRWFKEQDLWILDVLAEEGYLYDSSLNPILRRFSHDSRRFEVHRHHHSTHGDLSIWEIPISTMGILGFRIAISGGNYIRQFPHAILRRATARWERMREAPLVFYFMPWEIDSEQPSIRSISLLRKIRHYRNLTKTRWVLEEYLAKFRLRSIGEHLGIPRIAAEAPCASPGAIEVRASPPEDVSDADLEPVTVVIPLFNEEKTVPYLERTLRELKRRLGARYRVHFNLVDDGSSDGTWPELEKSFSDDPRCTLLRHPVNRGVAAAIMTGIDHAATEIVCSIDSDCSYDPVVLEEMIPRLGDADMVTASPYHPAGRVFNVPRWRLFLSRTCSRLYSRLLHARLHTFTSMCRVYRKSAVSGLRISHGGFLGVAEMLILVILNGGKVVEHPATLEARLFGESKMKVLRTIWSHLKLSSDIMLRRRKPTAARRKRAKSPVPPQ